MCTLHQLRDGTYSLGDLRDFHEVLDQRDEYDRRWRAYYKANPES